MSVPGQTRAWILNKNPSTRPTYSTDPQSDADFVLKLLDLPMLGADQIFVKTLYLSNDPAQRTWIMHEDEMPATRLYIPPVSVGNPMYSLGLGKVLRTTSPDFSEGDFVSGLLGWREYVVMEVEKEKPILSKVVPIPGLSLTHFLGAFGLNGLTAYHGLVNVAKLQKGETVVVSGAAGATGSMAVQIAKHLLGASQVIGIAGTEEKCRWVESLGADQCLNYKTKSFEKDLQQVTQSRVNVYFDNVGGSILDAMLANMAMYGRVAACGALAKYNGEDAQVLKNYLHLVTMRLQIIGFISLDVFDKAGEIIGQLVQGVQDGKVRIGPEHETVVDVSEGNGFEDIPKTWLRLFDGNNQGKLVTKL